jgi:hypothetical protein
METARVVGATAVALAAIGGVVFLASDGVVGGDAVIALLSAALGFGSGMVPGTVAARREASHVRRFMGGGA